MYGEKVGPLVGAENKFTLDNMELDNRDSSHV